MSGAIWLASYPRSGNTWVRLALKSLQGGGEAIELADVTGFGAMTSGRRQVDDLLEADSGLLTPDELEALRPDLHAASFPADEPARLCKTHDAWFRTAEGRAVFDAAFTHAAIYILRDPRDVAVSWARFTDQEIDRTIAFMGDPTARLAAGSGHIGAQIPQRLGRWSDHAVSWIDESGLDPLTVRYEDMAADPGGALAAMAAHLGWPADGAAIEGAVAATGFERLAEKERRFGFIEASERGGRFFTAGRAGGWRDVLTADQARRIEHDHAAVMERFGYL